MICEEIPKTKREALELGLSRYLGKPCKRFRHTTGRFVANGGCIECHRSVTRLAATKCRKTNPDKRRKACREHYWRNADKMRNRASEWAKENKYKKLEEDIKQLNCVFSKINLDQAAHLPANAVRASLALAPAPAK